jgi:biotin carboxyl carrier protein
LSEILRRMELRGDDLETSVPIHYGLVNWTLGVEPMMKPNTNFMTPYLAAVGALEILARDVDADLAAEKLMASVSGQSAKRALATQETLLLRPIRRLFSDAHALAGFLGLHAGRLWKRDGDDVSFIENPMVFLRALYHYLNMETVAGKPACDMIWDHDEVLLEEALEFYESAGEALSVRDWPQLAARLEGKLDAALVGKDAELWEACRASHRGFQIGAPLLMMIPRLGLQAGFLDIHIDDSLEPIFPEQFMDEDRASELRRALAPPPKASANQIVTPTGGSFYSREAPHLPQLVSEGEHFDEGQPLFIIEVMKMFNKILAPFAGTLKKNLMKDADGSVVKAGQVMFEIEPDEVIIEESDVDIRARRKRITLGVLGA